MIINVDNAGVKNTAIGVTVPMGAATIKAAYRTGDSANATAIGVDYALSKRTVAFADFGDVKGAAQSAYRFGLRHSF
jgi:predicted porin